MGRKSGNKTVKKNKFLLKYGFWIAAILFLVDFFVLFFLRNYSNLSVFADFMNVIIAAGIVVIAYFCYSYFPKKDLIKKNFFLFLLIAFIIRLLGEILWAYYDLSGIIMPPFSFADLAWVISNLTILFALEYKLRNVFIPHKKIIIAAFTLVLLTLSGFFIWGVYLRLLDLESGAWLAYLINESYVLFDLFILTLIVTPLYSSIVRQSKSFYIYFFMALGFIAVVVYDFLFAKFVLEGTYFSGGKIEILYFLSYFLIYCAFYFRYRFLENRLKKTKGKPGLMW
jgi:hypothetical protein